MKLNATPPVKQPFGGSENPGLTLARKKETKRTEYVDEVEDQDGFFSHSMDIKMDLGFSEPKIHIFSHSMDTQMDIRWFPRNHWQNRKAPPVATAWVEPETGGRRWPNSAD